MENNRNMVTLKMISEAVKELKCEGNKPDFDKIIESLADCQAQLNELKVRGRVSLDVLLGCIIGIEMIIGEEE